LSVTGSSRYAVVPVVVVEKIHIVAMDYGDEQKRGYYD
jgi:hypothetical protein